MTTSASAGPRSAAAEDSPLSSQRPVSVLSVVVPAHNESGTICWTIEGIGTALARAGIDYEVLILDDASTDGTASIVKGTGG